MSPLPHPARRLLLARLACGVVLPALWPALRPESAHAAELHPRTIEAFNRYVSLTERRTASATPALWFDDRDEARRRRIEEDLRRGGLFIDRLDTRDGSTRIEVPDGLIHHWLGLVFVPGATTAQAVALLQDYDRHATVYAPAVQRSTRLAHDGNRFRVFLRFYQKKVLTVVVNSEHDARFFEQAPGQVASRIVSTRINEVENPGTPQERELPEGRDGGYLWRLNSYWRFVERDGGVYVQCESITLTRGIPLGLGWLVGPFVTSIPRETLEFTLATTRRVLMGG